MEQQTTDLQNNQIDYQGLLDYLSNISSIMLEANKDIIYKELQNQLDSSFFIR